MRDLSWNELENTGFSFEYPELGQALEEIANVSKTTHPLRYTRCRLRLMNSIFT